MIICKMIIKITIAYLCYVVAAQAKPQHVLDFEKQLKAGVDELFITGKTNDDLRETVPKIGLEHFLDVNYKNLVNEDLVCTACEVVIDKFIEVRRNGTDTETIAEFISEVCRTLHIQADVICDRLIEMHADIIVYIIDNKEDISGVTACPLVLQDHGCINPNPVEWSIDIHEGQTIDKPIGSNEIIKVLHISDIHYDANYQVGGLVDCPHPVCCEADSGELSKYEEGGAGKWSEYDDCDTPKHTVVAGLNWINEHHKDIEYIYFTGDIISHRIWATDPFNNTKDMTDILDIFSNTFGDIPVYPIVGNHEPHPLNTWSPEGVSEEVSNSWVFDVVADIWSRWLPEDTQETIRKGAYYTVLLRPGFRVIALNSNVAYTGNWWLLFEEIDPFGQLKWLEGVLYEAEQNGESVHILSHVPSGDSTSYLTWAREYKKIIERYSNTITGIFNGHSHKDELIVYFKSDEPSTAINVAWNGGSFTTFSNKNPNYRIYSVDAENFDILDYDEWTFNVTEANLTPDQDPIWYHLYSFKEAYGLDGVTPQDVADLTFKMAKDHSLIQEYYRYSVRDAAPSMEAGCDDGCMQRNLCEMVIAVYNDRTQCDALMDIWE